MSCRPLTLAESGVRISNAGFVRYVCSRELSQAGQEFVPHAGHPLVQLALLYLSWWQLLVASKDHAVVVLRCRPLPRQSVTERPGRIGIPELVRNSMFTDFYITQQLCFLLCLSRVNVLHAQSNKTYFIQRYKVQQSGGKLLPHSDP
jgi:hypothetical protein